MSTPQRFGIIQGKTSFRYVYFFMCFNFFFFVQPAHHYFYYQVLPFGERGEKGVERKTVNVITHC